MKAYFEHLYEHVGYLFYAMAAEDRKLSMMDWDRLNRLIDQQWHPAGNGQSLDSHLISQLHLGLKGAFNTSMQAEEAFAVFQNYHCLHGLSIGEALRLKIFVTAEILACGFSSNAKQSVFMAHLAKMFKFRV